MNLNILHTFITVVEEGNFSKAANKLHLSQPAVSMQMQSLASELELNLFLRVGKKVQLTEGGHLLYKEGKEILNSWDSALNKLENYKNHMAGKLKIGASTIPGQYYLPRTIKAFKESYPKTEISIVIKDSREITKDLIEGNIDIAFIGKRVSKSGISTCKWVNDKIILIKGKDFKIDLEGELLNRTDIKNYPLIMRREGSATRAALEDGLKSQGIKLDELNIVLELDNTENIIAAVEAGMGLSLVSKIAALRGEKLGTLDILRSELEIDREIYYAFRTDMPNNICQSFLSFLTQNGGM